MKFKAGMMTRAERRRFLSMTDAEFVSYLHATWEGQWTMPERLCRGPMDRREHVRLVKALRSVGARLRCAGARCL